MSGLHHAHRLSQGSSSDLFQGYGTLVMILVGVHVAAFLFWIVLLVVNPANRKKAEDKRD
ncbi:hypothetical protein TSOC_004268 [Tetrabaena socialis]|uniref:Transmembrane protein n=1 Tax=Tetrabaena socialis TaxID=47790 RepID=A0A2J8A9D6_9CHLO|nr:hypothetical protein TSOC_004268 [Tetrabaena socialis]|eukprot:PNH09144.1 hypothetical protein TSOC_004268 [Tetrabaena socialis]